MAFKCHSIIFDIQKRQFNITAKYLAKPLKSGDAKL